MKYICLIYADEQAQAEQGEALFHAYNAFYEDVTGAGKFVAGDPLEGSATSTMVQVRNGETLATDGPFAETKEQIVGYYIFDCEDLDEAVEWAAKIPSATTGGIEVRPIMKM